ncbi:MAG: hypothetical protein CVV27_16210, partial [Candidatus Melainabacteria bacterium HGW-Melainabacteria-1]
MKVLTYTLLLLSWLTATAAHATPEQIMRVDFAKPSLAFDWARVRGLADSGYETYLNLYGWSADGRFLIGDMGYAGSPIDTYQSLYLINVPARASYRIFTTGRFGMYDPGLIWTWNRNYTK